MIEGKELESILPHKSPMILLSRIESYNLAEGSLSAAVEVERGCMFFDPVERGVPMLVGLEYMAQAIAALAGLHRKEFHQEEPKIGFIIGSRHYKCNLPFFTEGSCLSVKVKEIFVDQELAAFDCIITTQNLELAKAQINVFQPLSAKDFLHAPTQ